MARQSYFAEKREQNNDPNFFSRTPLDEIRRNVKRIVRDVKNGIIQPQDYTYFTNRQIQQACIEEAYYQLVTARTISNALNFYFSEGLNRGYKPFPSTNTIEERINVSNAQIAQNAKAKNWETIYVIFLNISNGADIMQSLNMITLIDGRQIAAL